MAKEVEEERTNNYSEGAQVSGWEGWRREEMKVKVSSSYIGPLPEGSARVLSTVDNVPALSRPYELAQALQEAKHKWYGS